MSGSRSYSNFQVTCRMQTPILLGSPWIHFDGVLKHLAAREALGEDFYTLPSRQPTELEEVEVPLARSGDVYHASVSWFDVDGYLTATIFKRFDERHVDLLKAGKRRVNLQRGIFRAYMMRMLYVPARTVTFYARGDVEAVSRLLEHLPALGKKTAYGYGAIKEITVSETEEDFSLVRDGVAMRPLPTSMGYRSDEVMMLAYKPPYWCKSHVAPCVPPGARVQREGESP